MVQDYSGNNFYMKRFIFSIPKYFQDEIVGNFAAEIIEPGSQPAFTCSKLTIEMPEQDVKYVNNKWCLYC